MTFDFDRIIDRRNTNSAKWDLVPGMCKDPDVIPMWVADMDFPTAPAVIEALKRQSENGFFGYTLRPKSYLQAVVDWVDRRHGWKIEPEWLTYSPGVVTALNLCLMTYTRPGDRVIIQPPVYYPFARAIRNNGRYVENNPLLYDGNRYTMDLTDLKTRAHHRTTMMILCSPHNPVGRVWHEDALAAVAEFCVENDILLVSDEIHSDLVFRERKHMPTASISEKIAQNTITCIAPSKTFNLAGLKTSVLVIPDPKLRRQYQDMLENLALGMDNSFGVVALEAAYSHGESWLEALLDYLDANAECAVSFIRQNIPGISAQKPEGTYLLWLDCRGLGLDSKALDDFMLTKARLWLDDGPMFGPGGEGFQRMNIACPRKTLERALERLNKAVVENT
ncbi:MAG: MalY/PatB family protein [Desulfobacterales bacterium]